MTRVERPQGRHVDSIPRPKDGMRYQRSNDGKMLDNRVRAAHLTCPVCGIGFTKPDAWLRRTKGDSYCSRACYAIGRRRRVKQSCVVCGGEMEVIPSYTSRTVTCSELCARRKKSLRSGDEIINCASSYAPEVVAERARLLSQGGACCDCGAAPTRVWGMTGAYTVDGVIVDSSAAFVVCDSCHGRRAVLMSPQCEAKRRQG